MSEYGVSYNTIVRWCQKIKINTKGGLMTPQHLQNFHEAYGTTEQ